MENKLNIIELLKTIGAIAGPILAAFALLAQRWNEGRQVRTRASTDISTEARKWVEEFREELRSVKGEAKKLRDELDVAKCSIVDHKARINDLQDEIEDLTQQNEQLRVGLTTLQSENQSLREEVVLLRDENTKLHQTVDQQAKRIAQLEGSNNS